MDFKEYPSYKDSEVHCLGQIPEHWNILQTRHLFNFSKGLTITKDDLSDEGIPCINYGEVHSKYGFEFNPINNLLKCVSPEFLETNKNCLLNKGDFVFADTSEDLEGSGNFTYLNQDALVFAGYHSIIARLKSQMNNARYFAYLFDSQAYRNQVRSEMKGVKVYSVSQGVLKSRLTWLPPIEEQNKIASFLDSETSRIDNLISKQEKLIKLLEEHRKSVISHTVTKGLDPNVTMRDSGIEWLGKVPEHWEIKHLKHTLEVQLRNGLFKSKDFFGSGNKLINVSDVYAENNIIDESKLEYVLTTQKELESFKVLHGDIFFVRSSLKFSGIAQSSCYLGNSDNVVFECHIVGARPNTQIMTPEFLIRYLNSGKVINELIRRSKTTTMTTIDQNQLATIHIAQPPIVEQQAINEYLDAKCFKINQLISKQKKLIEKLKSYRTSIISHAVTGKIDVRDLVV